MTVFQHPARHERGPQLAGDSASFEAKRVGEERLASRDRGVYEVAIARKDLTTRADIGGAFGIGQAGLCASPDGRGERDSERMETR